MASKVGWNKKPWKPNALERLMLARGHFPCPGCIGDPTQRIGKFERWQNRPQAAWRLYWKLRPHLLARCNTPNWSMGRRTAP